MKNTSVKESSITFGQVVFLAITGIWLYGLYVTFFYGRIPLLDWSTDHNLLLGLLWLLVIGIAAPVPAMTFVKLSGFVASTGRGGAYLPLFFCNLLLQLYFWILAVTIWFEEPLPWPLKSLEGGLLRGFLAMPLLIAAAAFGNFLCVRSLQRLLAQDQTMNR